MQDSILLAQNRMSSHLSAKSSNLQTQDAIEEAIEEVERKEKAAKGEAAEKVENGPGEAGQSLPKTLSPVVVSSPAPIDRQDSLDKLIPQVSPTNATNAATSPQSMQPRSANNIRSSLVAAAHNRNSFAERSILGHSGSREMRRRSLQMINSDPIWGDQKKGAAIAI